MSSLNLDPNKFILVTQLGIFLGSVVVVKKLMLDPYFKVKTKRDQLTIGNENEANSLAEKNKILVEEIDTKLKDAYSFSNNIKSQNISKAEAKGQSILAEADEEIKEAFKQLKSQIASELQSETDKIPKIIKALSQDIYSKVVS